MEICIGNLVLSEWQEWFDNLVTRSTWKTHPSNGRGLEPGKLYFIGMTSTSQVTIAKNNGVWVVRFVNQLIFLQDLFEQNNINCFPSLQEAKDKTDQFLLNNSSKIEKLSIFA